MQDQQLEDERMVHGALMGGGGPGGGGGGLTLNFTRM